MSDFFNGVFLLDPETNSQTQLFDNDLFGRGMTASSSNVYVSDFGNGIVDYDTASNSSSLLATLPLADDVVLDQNNDLIVVGGPADGTVRIDAQTGQITQLSATAYDDVVVAASGDVFVANGIDGLGRLNNAGKYISILDSVPGVSFEQLTLGNDGLLYATSFLTDVLYQVNPITGMLNEVTMAEFMFVEDIEANMDGSILIAARLDGLEGIFSVDPTTGLISTIIDEDDIDGPWGPLDLAVVRGELNSVIPEPAVLPLVVFAGLFITGRRKRA